LLSKLTHHVERLRPQLTRELLHCFAPHLGVRVHHVPLGVVFTHLPDRLTQGLECKHDEGRHWCTPLQV